MMNSQNLLQRIDYCKKFYHPIIIPFVFFFFLTIIPIELYVLGEGYGYGIRGICYKYQITGFGTSFIPLNYEYDYFFSGLITGRNFYATLVWSLGAVFYGICTLLLFVTTVSQKEISSKKIALGIFLSVGLFLFSNIIQYGPLFFGPTGWAVPFGIPILIYIGWFIQTENFLSYLKYSNDNN